MKLGTVSPSATGSNVAVAAPLPGTAASPVSTPAPPAPGQAARQAQPSPTAEAVRQSARQINAFLKSSSAGIEFVVDGQSNKVIVRVVDSETKQLIRQMPSEETLAISQALDRVTGLLLKQRA
jgi:flagellar protein FlaG